MEPRQESWAGEAATEAPRTPHMAMMTKSISTQWERGIQ